jgi:hypothetical protein
MQFLQQTTESDRSSDDPSKNLASYIIKIPNFEVHHIIAMIPISIVLRSTPNKNRVNVIVLDFEHDYLSRDHFRALFL